MITEIFTSFLYVSACVAVPIAILVVINSWWGR